VTLRIGHAAAIAALLLLVATACASDPAPAPAARTAPPELSVSLVQNRSDPPVGRLQLRVTNESDSEVRIASATLDSTELAAPAEWHRGTRIPAGITRDLPVQFPGASCAEGKQTTIVRLEVEAEPQPVTVEVVPTDPNERLPLLTEADCFLQQIASVGTLSLAGLDAADASRPARLLLRAASAGGTGTLRVTEVQSTVLFNLLGRDGEPANLAPVDLTLPPGEASVTVAVPIVPNRCDPHALAEDKVGTLFVFAAEVAGGRSGTVTLPASPDLRGDLYDYFTRACGL
jgi:hypothetical protein